jgi:hypothetical protein
MSLVSIDSVRNQTLRLLARMETGERLELHSFKRDRFLIITCTGSGSFLVQEKGFRVQEITAGAPQMSRLLKTLIKREFPRSRRVRLHTFKHRDG